MGEKTALETMVNGNMMDDVMKYLRHSVNLFIIFLSPSVYFS